MDPSTAITAERNNLLKRSGPEKPGDTFIFDSSLYMVIDETDKGAEEKTYASVAIETGRVSYAFANGSVVKRVECEVSLNQ